MVGLYFHIPFCQKKCDYCHFYVIPNKDAYKEQYMEGLFLEWEKRQKFLGGEDIASIYFGGGTPSLLGPSRIAEILSWAKQLPGCSRDVEITLEVNPEDADPALMKEYALAGINRCSLGIQALDDDLLKRLSRGHNAEKGICAVHAIYDAGITNLSIDLMYDIPGQTFSLWRETLKQALMLPITHLSIYNLVIEPQTVFYKKKKELSSLLPDEETSTKMYEEALFQTAGAGFLQYEISAFATPGFHSRHNRGYWEGVSFMGFGPSAFSYWEGKRSQNVANLSRYHKLLVEGMSPVNFEEQLEGKAKLKELLAIRLRLNEGVDLSVFETEYGSLDDDTHRVLQQLQGKGLLSVKNDRAQLTDKGILFYDTVASEIV